VRGMTFKKKPLTSQPLIEVAGRRLKCYYVDNVLHVRGEAAAQPELDCPDDDPTHFIVLDRPSGHTR
jgi:hypothetical protein